MKALLFNVHDLVLLLTLGICALLASIFAVRQGPQQLSRYFLSGFFILNALIALDKLIFWGEAFRYQAFDYFPPALLLFSFASFMVGPVLYWHTCSRALNNFAIAPATYFHLLPALATPFYLYFACFQFPQDVQRELLLGLKIYDKPELYFNDFITLKKLMPLVYGALTFGLLIRYPGGKSNLATPQKEIIWLKFFVVGFLFTWLWALGTHLYGAKSTQNISDALGIAGNYFTLTLITIVVFYELTHFWRPSENGAQKNQNEEPINTELAEQIRALMTSQKPFLNPHLTLDRFAKLVKVPPRRVSLVINRYFDQNFHEYVNRYRIEEAKRMLSHFNNPDQTIQDVAQRAGFNSKATFNRFFKNIEALTPSEYRQKYASLQEHGAE